MVCLKLDIVQLFPVRFLYAWVNAMLFLEFEIMCVKGCFRNAFFSIAI